MKDSSIMSYAVNRYENSDDKENAPILCNPYLLTIEAIYHKYYSKMDHIIFRLATDKKGNVIKEPWSPGSSNSDKSLNPTAFGYAMHHLIHASRKDCFAAKNALELLQSKDNEPYNYRIIYPVGPNFISKTIEMNWAAMAATVIRMESGPRKRDWIMTVYEIMERNLLNDTEYFIGLPTFDTPVRKS
jgi:hypothetical protein